MKITKLIREKAMQRLVKVENLNISKTERKIRKTVMWSTIALCSWVTPFTADFSERIIIENAAARDMPEITELSVSMAEYGGGENTGTGGESIESLIRSAFPDNPDEALKIARCESTLDPEKVGDHHLTFIHNGQEYGKSYGLFQIRSGGIEKNGKIWTRTDNVEQFEKDMKDPKKNLEQAKKIFQGSWYAWYNCGVKEGLL